MTGRDSFGAESTLEVGERQYRIHRLSALEGVADLDRRPVLDQAPPREPAPPRGRRERGGGRHRGIWPLCRRASRGEPGDRLLAGADPAPGLHRRARASSTSPPCATPSRRSAGAPTGSTRSSPSTSSSTTRSSPTSYGRRDALQVNTGPRVRAQRRALPLPALGPAGLLELPGRASRHRHLPPVQPRVPEQRRVHRRRRHRLPRHRRRNRLAHARW